MTNLSDFSEDEVTQLLEAPGAVLTGATLASGQPGPLLLLREAASGAKAFKEAQKHENEFVRSVAIRLRDQVQQAKQDRRAAAASDPEAADADESEETGIRSEPAEARDRAVDAARAAVTLLRERADGADADAYAAWLVRIATRVGATAKVKQGGMLSKRTPSEAGTAYIERVRTATSN